MADFRDYIGLDLTGYLQHYGVGHEQGGHSGRYPWGHGDRPKQDSPIGKGSESRKFKYVASKSMVRNVDIVLKKMQENKITIETIHTAKAEVTQANQEYLSYIGYGKDKDKQKLNREEKTQTVLNVQANNHENRPHARHQKIAEGTAKVKVIDAESNQQHLPALYATTAWQNYVPKPYPGSQDIDLPTLDGTTNEGYRPDPSTVMYMTQEQYDSLTQKPVTDTFLTYYGKEKQKLDKMLNKPSVRLVLGMAKIADKVAKVLNKLKNVIVESVENIKNRK